MRVTYTKTMEDLLFFHRHHFMKSASMRRMYYLQWLSIPIVAAILVVPIAALLILATFVGGPKLEEATALWLFAICGGAAGVLYLVFFPQLHRFNFTKTLRAYYEDLGMQGRGTITLEFSDNQFVEITATTRTESRWMDMKGMEIVGDYTFIYVTGEAAAVLPRHGFQSDAEYETARDFAAAKLGLSKGTDEAIRPVDHA